LIALLFMLVSSLLFTAYCFYFVFFFGEPADLDLHSFPTRRSSDLRAGGAFEQAVVRVLEGRGRGLHHVGIGHGIGQAVAARGGRSEEHTSELQSHLNIVCRLLLENKKYRTILCNEAYSVLRKTYTC